MNKKTMIILAAALVLLMILGIALGMGGKKAPAEEPTTEATVETTEATVPGVVKSIFDEEDGDDIEIILDDEPTQQTKPQATIPADSNHVHGDNKDQEVGIQDPEPPEDNDKPQATKPTEPSKPADPTQPTEKEPDATQSVVPAPQDPALTEYEKFRNMSPADQQAFMDSFPDMEDFFLWLERVKAEYDAANPPVYVGDGNINLDDYQ